MLQSYEYLESNCVGINSAATLKGSFYLVAQNIAPKNSNSYKAMVDWSIDQLFAPCSCYNFEKSLCETFEDILRLTLNELAILRKVILFIKSNCNLY